MNKPFDMYSWRRRFFLMAENDTQFPIYDSTKHKTLLTGAIDYELDGDNIVAYLPFEEEPEQAVKITFPKSKLESYLDVEIDSDEDLQDLDYLDQVYPFFHNKSKGPLVKSIKERYLAEDMMDTVDNAYYEVIDLIRQKARMLNDDDAYAFHEKLKGFFNRLLQEGKKASKQKSGDMLDLYEKYLNKK
jgi:hypothetical protein